MYSPDTKEIIQNYHYRVKEEDGKCVAWAQEVPSLRADGQNRNEAFDRIGHILATLVEESKHQGIDYPPPLDGQA